MPPLSNAERQARFRKRQSYEQELLKKQIALLEQWVNELQQKAGVAVRQLPKSADEESG